MSSRIVTGILFSLASLASSAVSFGACSAAGDGASDPAPGRVEIDEPTFKTPAEVLDACERGTADTSLDCAGLLRATWCTPGHSSFQLSEQFTGYAVDTDRSGAFVCARSNGGEQG